MVVVGDGGGSDVGLEYGWWWQASWEVPVV